MKAHTALCSLLLVALPSTTGFAANLVVNGNFDTGTLAGWTVFTTANGTTGAGLPNVVSFNTSGGGASNAAHFDVGTNVLTSQQGGGLSQTFMAPTAGTYNLSEDFASQDDANGLVNSDAGTFSLLIDGVTVATDSFGAFATAQQILMGSFSVSVNLTAGPHTLETEITRVFNTGGSATPDEYVDNISLTSPGGSQVPEPNSLILLGSGALGLAGAIRRRLLSI